MLDGGSFSHSLGKYSLGSPALLNVGMAWGDISFSIFIHCLYAVDTLRVTHYLSLPDISTPVHNQICILNRSYFNTRCKWDLRCFTHMADLINNHAYSENRAAYRRQSKQMSFVSFLQTASENSTVFWNPWVQLFVCANCELIVRLSEFFTSPPAGVEQLLPDLTSEWKEFFLEGIHNLLLPLLIKIPSESP